MLYIPNDYFILRFPIWNNAQLIISTYLNLKKKGGADLVGTWMGDHQTYCIGYTGKFKKNKTKGNFWATEKNIWTCPSGYQKLSLVERFYLYLYAIQGNTYHIFKSQVCNYHWNVNKPNSLAPSFFYISCIHFTHSVIKYNVYWTDAMVFIVLPKRVQYCPYVPEFILFPPYWRKKEFLFKAFRITIQDFF